MKGIPKYAAKSDSNQSGLVDQLRDRGIEVWIIRRPCDLLLRFWCERHQWTCWQTLEVKNPNAGTRHDQEEQRRFIQQTNTPVATDIQSALRELSKFHTLPRIQVLPYL